ncbi:MAG TPA: NADH:flavin oxidoreductase/NADH oxidase, partial [Flavisolibacter sp.]|nr:NADH:flavin oxidoreductase/NADH oxidase [Flavisolibacter sp.]
GSHTVGGAGLIITEATAVSPEGRITHKDLGIWKDEHIEELRRITTFIEAQGSVPGMQLAHAGRKASHHEPWKGGHALKPEEGAWITKAPSKIAYKEGEPEPGELTKSEIQKVINDFAAAAERARKAGFKLLELHGAHGYLLHEFLSPISNTRTDEYGGSFENRTRILIEIIEAIKKLWPEEFPLFVRISATDWVEGGWLPDDSIALAKKLKSIGIDLIDCSTGGNSSRAKIPVGPMYQVPFAERIKKETGIMTGAVGLITTAQEAESILAHQQADLVILARQLLRDPYFPLHAAKELGVDIKWPDQYERAKK